MSQPHLAPFDSFQFCVTCHNRTSHPSTASSFVASVTIAPCPCRQLSHLCKVLKRIAPCLQVHLQPPSVELVTGWSSLAPSCSRPCKSVTLLLYTARSRTTLAPPPSLVLMVLVSLFTVCIRRVVSQTQAWPIGVQDRLPQKQPSICSPSTHFQAQV